ncbi:hypothetical protein JB92DRAFT_3142116 [Gautieria morchelliformis]|nr:hypothetical protein JB92DRAFT_3142116 [Gautieria morchelliformis]
MTSKPRPSVLDLFDPLLVAVRVPIPQSPPTTPQKVLERGVENKENLSPNELAMSVFFNRISSNTYSPTLKPTNISSGLLVELEDPELGLEDDQDYISPRVPLTELTMPDFPIPASSPTSYGSSPKKTSPRCHSSASAAISLPPSPLRQTQLASSPFPAISVNDALDNEGSLIRTTNADVDSAHDHEMRRGCHGLQTPPSKGLLLPNDHTRHTQSRRRSSVDILTTLSSLSSFSSGSFHLPDASFDLVNGEISFLNRSSEESDTDHDILVGSLEPQTPPESLSPQTLTSNESSLGLPMEHLSKDTPLTSTSAQPSIGQAEVSSWSQLPPSHSQPSLPTGFRSSGEEHLSVQALHTQSTTITGGQNTPPSARRVSSVPAPVKTLRVFTSKHHHTAFTVAKRGTAGTLATSSGTSLMTKISPRESARGCGASCPSGIPRGSGAQGAGVDGIEERRKPTVSKRAPPAKPITSNMKAPGHTARSTEASTVLKEEVAERVSRTSTISRLPGPAGTVVGPSRRSGSAQNGRSIPVRSTSSRSRPHQLETDKPT